MALRFVLFIAIISISHALFAQTVQIDNLRGNKTGWGVVVLDKEHVSLVITLKHLVEPSYEGSIRDHFGFAPRNVLYQQGDLVVLGFNRGTGTGAYLLSLNDKGRVYVDGEESDYFLWKYERPPRFITSLTADRADSGQPVLDHNGHLVGLVQSRLEDDYTPTSLAFNEGRHMVFVGVSAVRSIIRRYNR